MTSPAFAQRLPDVYADPLEYQPDRYLPPREEDKAAPFSFIGFVGGRHACLGQNFAYLQIKVCPDVYAGQIILDLHLNESFRVCLKFQAMQHMTRLCILNLEVAIGAGLEITCRQHLNMVGTVSEAGWTR